jgi:hypothetical protein
MSDLTKKAIQVIDKLLALPEKELLLRFEQHSEGDFGSLLENAGFFNVGHEIQTQWYSQPVLLFNTTDNSQKYSDVSAFTNKMINSQDLRTVVGTRLHLKESLNGDLVNERNWIVTPNYDNSTSYSQYSMQLDCPALGTQSYLISHLGNSTLVNSLDLSSNSIIDLSSDNEDTCPKAA